MVLETNSNQPDVHDFFVNPINNQSAVKCFGGKESPAYHGTETNLNKYLNEKAISEMINVNSEIGRILKGFKISIKINMKILNNLVQNHLPHTRNIALGIANNLPHNFKSAVNRKALVEATSLHDIAKVIIPENIINKAGALNEDELEIMKEHAMLSYEMLKTTDLDKATLDLIKNHHHPSPKTGPSHSYSHSEENSESDINLQILSIADIYSALREKRSYKPAMSKKQALEIINKEVEQGKFESYIYKALVEYADKEEKSQKLNNCNSQWQIFNRKLVNSFGA